MIVTQDTTQGDYAEKYGLGVVVKDGAGLPEKLQAFIKSDYTSYCKRCNDLLILFLIDQIKFEDALNNFIREKR